MKKILSLTNGAFFVNPSGIVYYLSNDEQSKLPEKIQEQEPLESLLDPATLGRVEALETILSTPNE